MEKLPSKVVIHNLSELNRFWQELVPQFKDKCVLLLSGDVGAGKTTSVQIIAQILGVNDVQSPSFAIHLRYEGTSGVALDHIDLYRLQDDEDLESSGFWDIFSQDQALVVIEWADRLNFDYLPLNWQKIHVQYKKLSEDERELLITRW